MRLVLFAVVLVSHLALGVGASAQLPTALPAPSTVGRDAVPVEPALPRQRPDVAVPDGPVLEVPADLRDRRVTIRQVSVEGSSVFSAADLAPVFAPVINREVAFAEIVAAVNRLAGRYADAGYVFYNVLLPQQDFSAGRLRVIVVEGAVSRIDVGQGVDSAAVRDRLNQVLTPLVGRKPLTRAELERRLLIANDIAGLTLKVGTFADSAAGPGAVALVVDGSFERFSPIVQVDSFQTTADSTVNFRVGGIGRSLLLGGDALEARYIVAVPWDRMHLGDVRYSVPVGADGGRLGFVGQAVWQRPPTTLNGLPASLLGRSLLARAQYSHPLILRRTTSLVGFATFDVIEVDYRLQGAHIPGDSLRVLRAGGSGAIVDDGGGVSSASMQLSFGLDLAGARTGGRAVAHAGFAKLNVSLEHQRPLGSEFTTIVRATAQAASTSLPVSETFAFGGRQYGRGFVASEALGDHGFAASAEIRYAPRWLDALKPIVGSYLYAFVDYGRLWARDSRNALFFAEGVSGGGGVHLQLFDKVSGEVEVTRVLAGRTSASATPRPWRFAFRVGSVF
ncbi:MAG: ShlB/FhaC/HecB family hemolysin secretion/activation protein [Alphaproteobacteria bacterium]|nr:ShlB/FhaC/HecB family hemolysin secretion/activation protein [Alphaproteobacteria bacterium]MCW5743987.1 ShlB/FhaC/HecB family hemolysin secretion/activation protein [Alphaproteobacteria bacterium]